MIRRWSYINSINLDLDTLNPILTISRVKIFKNAVFYKRYTWGLTKFKRKAFIRIRHRTSWLPYSGILYLWAKDFVFYKHYFRFQFLNGFLLNNFVFYNFNIVKNRSEAGFYNFNFIFASWTRKSHFYFHRKTPSLIKYDSISVAHYLENPISDKSVVPVFNEYDYNYFLINSRKIKDSIFDDLFNLFFMVNLYRIIELRKIFNFLFIYFLFDIHNVK